MARKGMSGISSPVSIDFVDESHVVPSHGSTQHCSRGTSSIFRTAE